MLDERVKTLAKNLINYSVRLQPGEKVLIEVIDGGHDLAKALVAEAYRAGGTPFVTVKSNALQRALLLDCDKEQLELIAGWEAHRMQDMDAYIAVRAYENVSELSDLPPDKSRMYQQLWWKPVHTDIRIAKTKWCVLRYPGPSMAQMAGMSTEAFTDFYFKVSNLDYARMAEAEEPLVKLVDKTERVRITGPGTDLAFSIKGIPVMKSCGLRNIPDGEVFTAPVKDSVNGVITYNCPTISQGTAFDNIRLRFEKGKIIEATANHTGKLNQILDTDEGARYIGEFALGLNPHIHHPMRDILFDEKICGSFHLTPGNAYATAFNGNRSAIHWDLVCIQTPAYGGGEIWFDDRLVRKNGKFVLPELAGLNPENWV
ncbi:Aminopeptidase T [Sporomusa carbonis]|uniref:aminopeptidase n=1 Tax=Sporomusa carbonis TaxID=3076075 RepID=UPI003A710AB8